MTQVQDLARYAARATFDDLSPESRRQLPVHILDSLGCYIAALGASPIEACRQQVADFGGTGPCALIGGQRASPIYAAFWHTALVRYVDFMDNFLAPTETCHTADNFGVALTIAEYAGGSGRDLMLGVALAYTVQLRFVDLGREVRPARRRAHRRCPLPGDQGRGLLARKPPGQGPDRAAQSGGGA